MKEFSYDVNKAKAWAVIDSEAGCVGVFETREEARDSKRYATLFGHSQVIVKLKFDKVVR